MGKRPHARRVNRQPMGKNTRRVAKRTARKRPMARDPMVAKYWDEKLTVRQNYANLGLAHKVNGVTGGTERTKTMEDAADTVDDATLQNATQADPLFDGSLEDPVDRARASASVVLHGERMEDIDDETLKRRLGPGRAMVKRDEQGKIIKVVMGESAAEIDGLIGFGDDEAEDRAWMPQIKAKTSLVKEMEKAAAEHVSYVRFMGPGEKKWAQQLIAKYGDRYEAMFWDIKLNKLQRPVGQIRKVCERYLAECEKAQEAS